MRAATNHRRSERKRSKGGRRTAGGEGSCDELRTRTKRNHRLVRHPEDGSAHPQRNAACANQPSIRLVVTEQEGSDIRSRPFGVRPSYDDELGAVEAFGLDPGAPWRRTWLSAIRPGLFPCMRRAPHWKTSVGLQFVIGGMRLDASAGHTHAFGVGFDFISRRVEAALGRRPSSRHDTLRTVSRSRMFP
jgi:hypothetical protein